jgi:lipoate-protein ligase A
MTTKAEQSRVLEMTPEEYTRSDEELLRAACPAFRVAILSGNALSVGVSQRENAPCIVRARRLGIPVVRRSTGGLGLWHAPGDLVWSRILSRADSRVGNDFSRAFPRLGAPIVQFLHGLGIRATWEPPLGSPGEYCLLSGRGAVLTTGGVALGGAAQHLTREALLHHGVLPYHLDPPRLQDLFDLRPDVVNQQLCSLDRVTGGMPPTELASRLLSALATEGQARPG